MKVKRLGMLVLTATLAFVLAGCNLLGMKIGEDAGKTLVGTYELESMEVSNGSQTSSISKEQYQELSKMRNIHITLELSEDGSAVLNAVNVEGSAQKVQLKWKSDDGKSITFTSESQEGQFTATVSEDNQITVEQSQDKASVKMVFSKVSDKPGYYDSSSKN